MLIAVLLGFIQGITEWLPVSSEGIVAVVYSIAAHRPMDEAVAYALWLHLGTALSALTTFRSEVGQMFKEIITFPRNPSPLLKFLTVSTLTTAMVALPLLDFFSERSDQFGAGTMGLVGFFMFITGVIQISKTTPGRRDHRRTNYLDSLLTGGVQGLAALPGLSRSGLTIAILLARGIQRREALVLSFLMSIPVSIGAAIYSGLSHKSVLAPESLVATAVAFLVGLATIRILLRLAASLNFGVFVIGTGWLIILGVVVHVFR